MRQNVVGARKTVADAGTVRSPSDDLLLPGSIEAQIGLDVNFENVTCGSHGGGGLRRQRPAARVLQSGLLRYPASCRVLDQNDRRAITLIATAGSRKTQVADLVEFGRFDGVGHMLLLV